MKVLPLIPNLYPLSVVVPMRTLPEISLLRYSVDALIVPFCQPLPFQKAIPLPLTFPAAASISVA